MLGAMSFLADDLKVALSNPDRFLPVLPTSAGRRKYAETLRGKLSTTKFFFLDDEFTRQATWLGVQHPEILLSALTRARAPYAKTWIEWPKAPQMEAAGQPTEYDTPERAGVLIERLDEEEPIFNMATFSKTCDAKTPYEVCGSPLRITFHLRDAISELYPAEEQKLLEAAHVSQEYTKVHLLGSAYNLAAVEEPDPEAFAYRKQIMAKLTRHGMYSISPYFRPMLSDTVLQRALHDTVRNLLRTEIRELAGSWRFIIAVLSLMNHHDYAQFDQQPRTKSKFVGGKHVPFHEHIMVRLRLPGKVMRERVMRDLGEAVPKPQRDVRGSWRTNSKWFPGLLGCEHVYVGETSMREVCVMEGCGHKRWWVNDYKRGNPEVGIITRDHFVTK